MCFFEQTRWECGFWCWGHFRQQCNKEDHIGETCGLKLVYETKKEEDICKLCQNTEKKRRRYGKMYLDVQRWQREGNRNATIERTRDEMHDILGQIWHMEKEHDERLRNLGRGKDSFFVPTYTTQNVDQQQYMSSPSSTPMQYPASVGLPTLGFAGTTFATDSLAFQKWDMAS
ncbi:uncharacterized protein FTOL_08645 [Fusarium torulosum]|uniref:Uncharacterized protein n=1 Tax=Fusarium torulosum TaxID=33205 RepID=A0AAE8ME27_9HYPO|nr:uncharacterized protein FTOL_08645 [Fusarium torulosum]